MKRRWLCDLCRIRELFKKVVTTPRTTPGKIKINLYFNFERRSCSPNYTELYSHFTLLLGSLRTAKKCTIIYNLRAEPLFYSPNLLFGGVLFVVAAMVCLSSLLSLACVFPFTFSE